MKAITNLDFEIVMLNSKQITLLIKDHKKQFRNTYNAYKKENTNIIHSVTRRKKMGRPKKKKEID